MNKRNFILFALPSVFNVFVGIALLPLFTQILGPEDYGLVAIFTTILGLILSLSDNGAGWVLASHFHSNELNLKNINFQLIFSSFILKILFIGVFYYFGRDIIALVGEDYYDVALIYNVILISFLFTSFDSVALTYMIFNEEAKTHMFSQISSMILMNLTVYTSLFYFDLGVLSLVCGLLISRIYLFIYFLIYMRDKIKISFDSRVFYEVRTLGFPALFKTTSSYILQNVDKILIQQLSSITVLGLYDFSLRFRGLHDVLSKSFGRVYGAYFYKSYKNFDSTEHMMIRDIWLGVNFLLSVLVIFFIGNVFEVLTNGKFTGASLFVQLFFVSSIVNSYCLFYGFVLIAEKQTMFVTKTSMGMGALSSACMYFSIQFFGPIGALYILNLSSVLLLSIYIARVNALEVVKFNDFLFFAYLGTSVCLLVLRNTFFEGVLVAEDGLVLAVIYVLISIPVFASFSKGINFLLKGAN